MDGGRLKSPHTIEIPFAFDNIQAASRLTGGGPEAKALADRVSDAWIAFARTGNPNSRRCRSGRRSPPPIGRRW